MTGAIAVNEAPPWVWPRAAYLHVPFCAHHCGYCDFAIAVGQDHLIDLYLDALDAEMATLETPQLMATLFIGGGTPTHLTAGQLARLLSSIRRWLPLESGGEWSIEANPDTLDDDKIAILANHGVNRVSLGAQSFHPHLLEVLDRRHSPSQVGQAVERVRRRIPAVSLDLIFGAPGQTEAEWRADLAGALALQPDHLSSYGLTYEKGTPLWKRRQRGQVRPLDEDAELALYSTAINVLEAAGFEHYEISSFARPGRRCRHNEVYWANEAYFGYGMGAARTSAAGGNSTPATSRRTSAGRCPANRRRFSRRNWGRRNGRGKRWRCSCGGRRESTGRRSVCRRGSTWKRRRVRRWRRWSSKVCWRMTGRMSG